MLIFVTTIVEARRYGDVNIQGELLLEGTTCLDVFSDQIYHDTDCDETKDAGENFIDNSSASEANTATYTVCASNALNATGCDYTCDGVADEVQIQGAIDTIGASGGSIILSDGAFFIEESIFVTPHQKITGQGLFATNLFLGPATPAADSHAMFTWDKTDVNSLATDCGTDCWAVIEFGDFLVFGRETTGSATGMFWDGRDQSGAGDGELRDVIFNEVSMLNVGNTTAAVYVTPAWGLRTNHLTIESSAAGLFVEGGTAPTNMMIHDCQILDNTDFAIHIKDVTGGSIMGCDYNSGVGATAAMEFENSNNISVIGNKCLMATATDCINIGSSTDQISIVGNSFDGTTNGVNAVDITAGGTYNIIMGNNFVSFSGEDIRGEGVTDQIGGNTSDTAAGNNWSIAGDLGIGVASPTVTIEVDEGTGWGELLLDGSSGGCLMMRDTDDGGWTECSYLNGTQTCTTDADGLCDGS